MLATRTGEATAEQTVELAEGYVRLAGQSDAQYDQFAPRANELVTIGLGRADVEDRPDLRGRLYDVADWIRDMSGVDAR